MRRSIAEGKNTEQESYPSLDFIEPPADTQKSMNINISYFISKYLISVALFCLMFFNQDLNGFFYFLIFVLHSLIYYPVRGKT